MQRDSGGTARRREHCDGLRYAGYRAFGPGTLFRSCCSSSQASVRRLILGDVRLNWRKEECAPAAGGRSVRMHGRSSVSGFLYGTSCKLLTPAVARSTIGTMGMSPRSLILLVFLIGFAIAVAFCRIRCPMGR
jgi:hypothetical protein